ncbi:MAG: 50S ribosomal protein L6 [Candidatus ainarchaeum sp.]|nr:50S ribosomal protein L6 [Candidatus ainarchaeum sp.]
MVSKKFSEKFELPQGMQASIEGGFIKITGPKGELKRKIPSRELAVKIEGNAIFFEMLSAKRVSYACLRSFEKHIGNMAKGLGKEFEYHLRVVYSHFPINIAVKGNNVEINNFLGEKLPRIARILPGAKVEAKGKEVFVRGPDKDAVGQTAANIEAQSVVSNKDRRVFQDGIFLVEKN